MKSLKPYLTLLALLGIGTLMGCSMMSKPDITDSLRKSLDQAGLKDVTATHDREKGVITLGGHVALDSDKAQAETLAKSLAGSEVVANQIAVIPVGAEKEAKAVNSDLDKGIEGNLDAALIEAKLASNVKYKVKNRVVTLTGDVDSQSKRAQSQQIASAVPNVDQVVNELQVKGQKATSSN
jgi:hyperosmotically inducible periplasmic protein